MHFKVHMQLNKINIKSSTAVIKGYTMHSPNIQIIVKQTCKKKNKNICFF